MTPKLLDQLQRDSFQYFLDLYRPTNGLVPDNTEEDAPASIAAVGFALASYPIGVQRGFFGRDDAVRRTLAALRFFAEAPQGDDADSIGNKGFYYHFLDMQTGKRVWGCELSTIDTAFMIAGALAAATYFDQPSQDEQEVRSLAGELYRRVDWRWALNGATTLSHGWTPEGGFLESRWQGYNEALLLYVLALGSPTYAISRHCYDDWTLPYEWRALYGMDLLHAGPLFIHQLSHIWLDFRGIQDEFMKCQGSDYFENSRRATYAHWEYARRNPHRGTLLGDLCMRRAGPVYTPHRWRYAVVLRLRCTRSSGWTRRRHGLPLGCRGLSAFCSRDCASHDRTYSRSVPRRAGSLRL